MRDRQDDELLRFARPFVKLLVTLDPAEVVIACTDEQEGARRDAIDHLYRFVFERLFDRLP
jgi:hypothetical protein